ncbi:hypothetical protein VOLCADRAFT_88028 [Volvox carteri f. nagariensis]|uniref:Protein kinase domain-containing protein n=1 Tax=Volvox carteri f. nagariensis TaxID=3068 RepID=D8TMW0_VOLCA|nr:uncharacterized protein VOLCADRAFT_88028 [Volvox carteri f. nagariensis]EFJ51196.1 hypothetical protein VOLCADRAFT_88028 [Volvox carteri f. nagariensis]|eukprot:XP_002947663.1 hypothetical protein VOLCADRAFT_88028 [Volvox carteri f. nagariensis]
MELMETSLERLMYGSKAETLMPLAKVLYISINVANALAYLHPTVVHRDLKPANVLMNNPSCDWPVVKLSVSYANVMSYMGAPEKPGSFSGLRPSAMNQYQMYMLMLTTINVHVHADADINVHVQFIRRHMTLGCRGFELRLNLPKHLMLARDRSKDRKMLQPPYMPPECFDVLSKHVTHQVVGLGVCLCVTNGLAEYVLSIIPGLVRCVRTCGNVTMCKEGVRKDIYSLGVLIWEMLAGKRPWEGVGNVAIAFMVTYKGLRLSLDDLPSSRCPAKLSRLLKACWESDPARRPAAAEVAKELTLVLEVSGGAAAANNT